MYRNILLGIITALTVILLIAVFLLGSQWFEEGQGDELFRGGKYEDAAEHFLRAYGDARFVGHSRLLYKIGLSYENARDFDRARDYYIELVRLFPDSPATKLVGSRLEIILRAESAGGLLPERLADLLPSGVQGARTRFVRSFQNLTRLVKMNRAGVGADLEAAYAAYKIYHAEYKKQLAQALEKYKEEHPGFVWPPPGAATGPDPVSVNAGVATPEPAPKTAPADRAPSKPRSESRPADVDRELSGAGAGPGGP